MVKCGYKLHATLPDSNGLFRPTKMGEGIAGHGQSLGGSVRIPEHLGRISHLVHGLEATNDCESGLQQPDPCGVSLSRAAQHCAHQLTPDRPVLRPGVYRYRSDTGNWATFVKKVTADDLSCILWHY